MLASLCTMTLVLSSLFGAASGQGAPEAEDFVGVKVIQGKVTKARHQFRVPVAKLGERGRKFLDDKIRGVGWESTGSCPQDIGCGGRVHVLADEIDGESVKVTVILEYKDRKRCDQTAEASVVRGKTTELKMKCGARVEAYFAPRQTVAG